MKHDYVDMKFLDQRLDQLDFGPGYNTRLQRLFKQGIWRLSAPTLYPVHVRDLVGLSEADIMIQVDVGRKTSIELRKVLARHGLHLAANPNQQHKTKPKLKTRVKPKTKPKTKPKQRLTVREYYLRKRASAARERAVMLSQLREISDAIDRIERMQHRITEVTSAVINDLHRRPLQIADINPEVFKRSVDRVARENPKAFDD